MKKPLTNLAILVFILSSCTCIEGEGEVLERNMELNTSEEIELSVPANVQYWQDQNSKSTKISIRAQENLLEYLEIDVKGDELRIRSKKCISSEIPIEIDIITPMLSDLQLNGSGQFTGKNNLETEDLDIQINGSSEVRLDLDVNEVETVINGTGNLILSGIGERMEIQINGSGDIDAYELEISKADIRINGSGDCEVNADEELKIRVNGSGDVRYIGSPKNIDQQIMGSGEVKQVQSKEQPI